MVNRHHKRRKTRIKEHIRRQICVKWFELNGARSNKCLFEMIIVEGRIGGFWTVNSLKECK